jgi:uncharacterized integral membrane protein
MSETYGGSKQAADAPPPPDRDVRRREDKPKTAWFVGVILIVLGAVFFIEQNTDWQLPQNWWAIFIYLGAIGAFTNMWREWKAAGWFDSKAAGSLTGGLVLTTVGTIAWFDAWERYWPFIIMAVGVGIVLGWLLGASSERQRR